MNYDLFIPSVTMGGREGAAQRAWHGASSGHAAQLAAPGDLAVRGPRQSASDPLRTEEITNAVAAFNDVFEQADVSVRYRIDEHTNDLVISLVDGNTDKVLRQMPPDAILKMRQRMEELLGLMFDTTA